MIITSFFVAGFFPDNEVILLFGNEVKFKNPLLLKENPSDKTDFLANLALQPFVIIFYKPSKY